jgi:hypothetical protein
MHAYALTIAGSEAQPAVSEVTDVCLQTDRHRRHLSPTVRVESQHDLHLCLSGVVSDHYHTNQRHGHARHTPAVRWYLSCPDSGTIL